MAAENKTFHCGIMTEKSIDIEAHKFRAEANITESLVALEESSCKRLSQPTAVHNFLCLSGIRARCGMNEAI